MSFAVLPDNPGLYSTALRQSDLLNILGGQKVMAESPLIQKLVAERLRKAILAILEHRFGAIPLELVGQLQKIRKEEKLIGLGVQAAKCTSLDAFREALLSR